MDERQRVFLAARCDSLIEGIYLRDLREGTVDGGDDCESANAKGDRDAMDLHIAHGKPPASRLSPCQLFPYFDCTLN
jgi:hypothetical protein